MAGKRFSAVANLLEPSTPKERERAQKELADRYWRRITDEVLERGRSDEQYRRDVLAALKAPGRGKRGRQGLPSWAGKFVYDWIEEMRAAVTFRKAGLAR